MGRPVITVPKGGLAVVDVTGSGYGLPVEETTVNNSGLPVTLVQHFGMPVTYVGGQVTPPNPGPLTRKSPDNMTDNVTPPPYVVTESSVYPPYYGYLCFNSTINSFWGSAGPTLPEWIAIDLASPKSVSEYHIQSRPDGYVYHQFLEWYLQGSADGLAWTDLDHQSLSEVVGSGVYQSFTLATPAAYRYWRFFVTRSNSGVALDCGNLGLFGYGTVRDLITDRLKED